MATYLRPEIPTIRPPRPREGGFGRSDEYEEYRQQFVGGGGGRDGNDIPVFRGGPGADGPGDMEPDGWSGPGPSWPGVPTGGGGDAYEPDWGEDGPPGGGDGGGGGGGSGEGESEADDNLPELPGGAGPRTSAPPVPGLPEVPDMPSLDRALPNFQGIADQLGEAERGPSYSTPSGAFMGRDMYAPMKEAAQGWLSDPSRYDAELVKEGLGVADSYLQDAQQDRMAELEERMAQRGLVGSSVEGQLYNELQQDLNRQLANRAFQLNREQATTIAQDRNQAMRAAEAAGQFGRGLGSDIRGEARYEHGAARQRARDYERDRRARTSTDLQAAGMGEDAYMGRQRFTEGATMDRFGAGMNRATSKFGMGMDRARFQEGMRQFDAGYGLDRFGAAMGRTRLGHQMDMDERRWGLQQEQFDWQQRMDKKMMEYRNRGLDEEIASRKARNDIAREELEQNWDRIEQGDMQFLTQILSGASWEHMDDETKKMVKKAFQTAFGGS